MIDAQLRRYIDPPLHSLAQRLAPHISADSVTVGGFIIGLLAIPALALQLYGLAIVLIALNRLSDGLDGALARCQQPTDFGGYLDIVCDFIFYSAVIFGFCLGRPEVAIYGAFLIFSFIGTGASFLAFSAIAAKRGLTTETRGRKSIYYLGGLTEGFETITVLVLICIVPGSFSIIAVVFGVLCWLTTLSRVAAARLNFA